MLNTRYTRQDLQPKAGLQASLIFAALVRRGRTQEMNKRIIERGEQVHCLEHEQFFERLDAPGSGFSFPCDAHGHIDEAGLAPTGRINMEHCIAQVGREYAAPKMTTNRWSYWRAPVMRCECGNRIHLEDPLTNRCGDSEGAGGCGRYWNSSAQELNPPHMWEENYEPEEEY